MFSGPRLHLRASSGVFFGAPASFTDLPGVFFGAPASLKGLPRQERKEFLLYKLKMSHNNPYINAYLQTQSQQGQAQQSQMGRVVHPQQSQYIPQYKMQAPLQQSSAPSQQVPSIPPPPPYNQPPREYTQFPPPKPVDQSTTTAGFGGTDQYSGLNVFEQTVMKNSLQAEKVAAVDRRTFDSQISSVQKNREEIDKQLAASKAAAIAPPTIKVEKKPIDDLAAIAARREQEAARLKVEKATNDASALLGATSVKKTDPSQLNRQMDDLIKRRQMEMQNITYNK